jgi:hypothetical protein
MIMTCKLSDKLYNELLRVTFVLRATSTTTPPTSQCLSKNKLSPQPFCVLLTIRRLLEALTPSPLNQGMVVKATPGPLP